jgi:lipoprotein-anchoring transpeptidase ErfK/SrfK
MDQRPGEPHYEWAVSTGRAGYGTPNGTYHPQRLERVWFSKKYYNSPMPHSIFFSRGFAIHGSYEINHLGGPRWEQEPAAARYRHLLG